MQFAWSPWSLVITDLYIALLAAGGFSRPCGISQVVEERPMTTSNALLRRRVIGAGGAGLRAAIGARAGGLTAPRSCASRCSARRTR
jgi:hypothetical protein